MSAPGGVILAVVEERRQSFDRMTSSAQPADATPEDDAETRGHIGDDRDRTANDRDETSRAHDEASDARDRRAEARDERAEVREEGDGRFDAGAASDRAGARRDRQGGASDRQHAGHDREAASADRALSARERAVFLVDELTGAHRRDAGLLELEREVSRATRTQQPFVLAFVDVDALKAVNDSHGHAAGDELLRHVSDTIRKYFRPYDLIVRYGGDEFLCGALDLGLGEVAARFETINGDLQRRGASVTAGLAELGPGEELEPLIRRADQAMYAQRQQRTAPPSH